MFRHPPFVLFQNHVVVFIGRNLHADVMSRHGIFIKKEESTKPHYVKEESKRGPLLLAVPSPPFCMLSARRRWAALDGWSAPHVICFKIAFMTVDSDW